MNKKNVIKIITITITCSNNLSIEIYNIFLIMLTHSMTSNDKL